VSPGNRTTSCRLRLAPGVVANHRILPFLKRVDHAGIGRGAANTEPFQLTHQGRFGETRRVWVRCSPGRQSSKRSAAPSANGGRLVSASASTSGSAAPGRLSGTLEDQRAASGLEQHG
jgi:hypothetical protein